MPIYFPAQESTPAYRKACLPRKHPQFCEMTMRKTGPASEVLELRSFYEVWVNSVFAKKRFFISFSTLIVKYHRGFALKLPQPSCLPHGTDLITGKKMLTLPKTKLVFLQN